MSHWVFQLTTIQGQQETVYQFRGSGTTHSKHLSVFYLVVNVLEQRLSILITEIFLYYLDIIGNRINSLNVVLKSVPQLQKHCLGQYYSLLPDPCI